MKVCFSDNTYVCCLESSKEFETLWALKQIRSGLEGDVCLAERHCQKIGKAVLSIDEVARAAGQGGQYDLAITAADYAMLEKQEAIILDIGESILSVRKSYQF